MGPAPSALSPGASSHPLYQPENQWQVRSHLADVEEQANALFLRLVKDYATSEGVTEQLKAEEPMEWVRRMNGIRESAREVVSNEVIFS